MQTTILPLARIAIADFAEEHGFNLLVKERKATKVISPWIAYFEGVTLYQDRIRKTRSYGRGMTPAEAIRDYAILISNKQLVSLTPISDRRSVIAVPALVVETDMPNLLPGLRPEGAVPNGKLPGHLQQNEDSGSGCSHVAAPVLRALRERP